MTDLHRALMEAAGLRAALAAYAEAVEDFEKQCDPAGLYRITDDERADFHLDAEAARELAEAAYLRAHPEAA